MKTSAFFGLMMALAGALLTLLLYFLDFHNDPGKFLIGAGLGLLGAIVITITGLVLGIRAVRKDKGPGKFSYGQALLAGVLISLFSSVFGTIFHTTYVKFINPEFTETSVRWMEGMMERGNVPADKAEEAIEEMRRKSTMGYQVRNSLIGGLVIGGLISLIAAAFLKRNPDDAEVPA